MTSKEYYEWAKKHKKEVEEMCKKCGVIKGHSGDICLICRDNLQKEIDAMKAKVIFNE